MTKNLIAASILSANFAKLGDDVSQVLEAGADLVHVDVMDNHYVPNLTFGPMICSALRDHGISAPFDVHLMVSPVDRMIVDFAKVGANMITIHPEATEHVHRSIQLIRDNGCKAGIALNPATPLNILDHLMDELDLILVMSVNPGFGGQSFIKGSLGKLQRVSELIAKKDIQLSVDGGVNVDNIASISKAGAKIFVAGSAIFKSSDYKETIQKMRKNIVG